MSPRPDPIRPPSPAPQERGGRSWNPSALKQFVRRIARSSADSEDIVQEAYLRLLESTGRGRVTSQLGYLLVIARNLVADAGRRSRVDSKRTVALQVLSQQLNPAEPSAEELVFVEQAVDKLTGALRALPQRPRQVFLLHRFRAMPHVEIAQRLGVTTRTVERDLALALAHLKDALFEGDGP
jgi:RNA polymerase sigma factor (sigma-70 family)